LGPPLPRNRIPETLQVEPNLFFPKTPRKIAT
jgi:hypothetical protein